MDKPKAEATTEAEAEAKAAGAEGTLEAGWNQQRMRGMSRLGQRRNLGSVSRPRIGMHVPP